MGMDPRFMIGVRFTGEGVVEYFEALLEEDIEVDKNIFLSRMDDDYRDSPSNEVVLQYTISWSWGDETSIDHITLVYNKVKRYCSRFDGGKFLYEIFFYY